MNNYLQCLRIDENQHDIAAVLCHFCVRSSVQTVAKQSQIGPGASSLSGKAQQNRRAWHGQCRDRCRKTRDCCFLPDGRRAPDASAPPRATHAPAAVQAPQFDAVRQALSADAKMANMWRSRLGSVADRLVAAMESTVPGRWRHDPIRRCAAYVPDMHQPGRRTDSPARSASAFGASFTNSRPHVGYPRGRPDSLRCRATRCHRNPRSRRATLPASSPRRQRAPRVRPGSRARHRVCR